MPKFTPLEADWMKQNGPGGWIDGLRNQVVSLTDEHRQLLAVVLEAANHLYDKQDMTRVREMAKRAIADIDKKRAGR